jgi:Fe-S oxidoreductase
MKINYGSIESFSCPSKALLHTKINGIEEIVSKIAANNLKSFKKANPKKLILGTPESFFTFSKEKDFGKVASFPDELLNAIKRLGNFSPIKKTVAMHHACLMEKDPFYEATVKLLKLIPGITIVELEGKCGHKGFESLDANSKESAINLMKKAVNKGAEMISCTSPYCESHLLMCQREGSWHTADIKVTNVYKLLLSSLEGGDI